MTTKLLTSEACEALGWLIDQMPDRLFKIFATEMEAAMRVTAMRFGFDDQLEKTFGVNRLISMRPELPPTDDEKQTIQALVYGGITTYAITSAGKVFHECERGGWRPSILTIDEVVQRSVTRTPQTIKIKVKYL